MAFKDYYDLRALEIFSAHFVRAWPAFPSARLLACAQGLDGLELKARVEHIARALHACLPQPFPEAAGLIHRVLQACPDPGDEPPDEDEGWQMNRGEELLMGFSVWPLTRFVALYGLGHVEASMGLLKALTRRFTGEFAIRYFLEQDPENILATLHQWTQDPDPHVRRLCSEGTRPRLPWGQHLARFREDPAWTLPLLEKLKDDESLYVRRSVANHLNDISYTHPEATLATLKAWLKEPSPERLWIANHACRSLIKQGQPEALRLLGFDPESAVVIEDFSLEREEVPQGEALAFTLRLRSEAEAEVSVMVDYAIHYRKASGALRPKVFKGARLRLAPGEVATVTRRRATKDTSGRKHQPGLHKIELLLNGRSAGLWGWTLKG